MKGELGQSWKRLNKKGKILLAICIAEAVFIMGLIFLFAFITGAFN
jgi:F0F1-type ATP synthase membrane subunit c/vacuolar-type H+-ATPase subunit K